MQLKLGFIILIAVSCFGQSKHNDAPTGVIDASGLTKYVPPLKTVGTLPAASSNNHVVFWVTDGQSASDCTVGGGSVTAICGSNGTIWVAQGGSGGGGGGGGTVTPVAVSSGDTSTVITITDGYSLPSCKVTSTNLETQAWSTVTKTPTTMTIGWSPTAGFTGTCTAISSGLVASPYTNLHTGAAVASIPEPCVTVVSTITTDYQQAATSAQVRLFTAPAYWSPRSFRVEETSTVTSGSGTVTALAACIGTSGTPCGYSTAFPLMGASSPAYRENAGGATLATTFNGTQDVYLQLAVTNTSPGNLSNLTGGSVTTRICGVTLQ